ncbi:DUF6316 family protein [Halioxenophilus aromaticivorans]|uniref:DUF6316 domain-containing protein n=1 Tax=Halioxenophilus aromaticivorans TaxID=1306992 RepID=A0AAV3U3D5_9ALTE
MNVREGEQERAWYRSDRFFKVNGEWYFSTREKIDVGPFTSRENASQGLSLFVENMQHPQSSVESAASVAVNGAWSWTNYH